MKTTLRLPDNIHAALTAAAKQDHRSLNGLIVHILTRHVDQAGAWIAENHEDTEDAT